MKLSEFVKLLNRIRRPYVEDDGEHRTVQDYERVGDR